MGILYIRPMTLTRSVDSVIKNTPPDEYIAQNTTGNKLNKTARERVWKSFKRQLNIEMGCKVYRNQLIPPYPLAPDLVPYCCRHEFCTDLARRHVDIRIAQKLMGHSDIQLTANIYTNLNQDDLSSIAEMLAGSPGVSPPNMPECAKMTD